MAARASGSATRAERPRALGARPRHRRGARARDDQRQQTAERLDAALRGGCAEVVRGRRADRPRAARGAARRRARALRLRRRVRAAGDRGATARTPRPAATASRTAQGAGALAPGEFVLGYPDEDTLIAATAAGARPLGRNGTYMVWRKLSRTSRSSGAHRRARGELYAAATELLAAKVVGRWRNGTPLVTLPRPPSAPTSTPTPPGANDFRYAATTSTAAAARSARTSAAPTRATRSASTASSASATG